MIIRTGFSFRTAIGHIQDVIDRLQTIGWNAAPLCDRVSTFGFNRWAKAASKAGLRPIFGVELKVGEGDDYWAFFSKTSLSSLHELFFLATSHDGLSYEQAMNAPDLIKITGHRVQLKNIKPQPDLFVPLTPSLPIGLSRAAVAGGFSFISTSDNAFVTKDQKELYRIALGRRADVQLYPQHIMSDDEWRSSVAHLASTDVQDQALQARQAAMAACQAVMKQGTLLKPQTNKTLLQLCIEGAERLSIDLNDPVYRERMERELGLIEQKKFGDYFFILADLVGFAKEHMIVGPARGSSCGSLVCYLLNITAVDPIPFGTIFERFIDLNREDLPDVDIDFSDERRHMLFEYAMEKYGKDRVARLGTVLMFKPRSILNQAGIALRIPKWEVEKLADTVIERSIGDSRALQTLEDTLKDTETGRSFLNDHPEVLMMAEMEGHPVVAGQHAAGIIITQEPISEYVAVDGRTGATMCDKKDAEVLSLLKIDALGLTQLSIFERCLEFINVPPRSGWLEKLPLDDQAAFDVLNKGYFAGIFQFNGQVLQNITQQLGSSNAPINHINDIIQITAIGRPGPAASGGTNAWIKRRTGQEPISTVHPMLTELTQDTYGVIMYQEQVMRIARTMGLLSWEDTADLRKGMSKIMGQEFFDRYWQKFRVGALSQGIEEPMAEAVWKQINTMGSWAFNLAHAVAYGLVSYYCCYLKAHYPMEFAAATLDAESLPERQIALLRELRAEGIDYKPFDLEHSTDRWAPLHEQRILIGPLTSIKGIGPAAVMEIMAARSNGQPIRESLRKKLEGGVTEIDSLYPIQDAIKRLAPNFLAVPAPISCSEVQAGMNGQVVVLGVADRLAPLDENEPIRVMRRGGRKYAPPTDALNLFLRDDTDRLLCRIDRYRFAELGRPIVEYGRPGKALYAIKGIVPRTFRMIIVEKVLHLGDLTTFMGQERGGTTSEKLAAGEQINTPPPSVEHGMVAAK